MDMWNRNGRFLWTHKLVAEEAKKYTSRVQFRDESSGAYRYACQNDIIDLVCAHMKPNKPASWTVDVLTKEAKNYNLISEFRKLSPNAFLACLKQKVLDSVCGHMADYSKDMIKKYKVKVLSNVDRALLRDTKSERENLGLRPLEVKVRTCIACGILFESIGDRTCGCTKGKTTTLAGIEVV